MEDQARAALAGELKLPVAELRDLEPEEKQKIAAVFRDRLEAPDANDNGPLARVNRAFQTFDAAKSKAPETDTDIDLREIHFSRPVVLQKWFFSGPAWFDSATFSGPAGFSNVRFEARTDFAQVTFAGSVPEFYQRGFHQNTDISTEAENWPLFRKEMPTYQSRPIRGFGR